MLLRCQVDTVERMLGLPLLQQMIHVSFTRLLAALIAAPPKAFSGTRAGVIAKPWAFLLPSRLACAVVQLKVPPSASEPCKRFQKIQLLRALEANACTAVIRLEVSSLQIETEQH